MRAIEQGIITASTKDKLLELEAQKTDQEALIMDVTETSKPDGDLIKDYRDMLENLSGSLDEENTRYKAMNLVRPLIDKIILHPDGKGLKIEFHGKLENIMNIKRGVDGNIFYAPESDIEQLTTQSSAISESVVIVFHLPYWERVNK